MNDRIGIIVPVEARPHLFEAAADFGVKRVELNGWNAEIYTPALAEIDPERGRTAGNQNNCILGRLARADGLGFYQRSRNPGDRSSKIQT